MTATADTRLRGRTRWSMAARCPRMAAYGLQGTDPDPLSAEQERRQRRMFRRGRRIGAEVAEDFAAKYGDDNIVLEKAVPWPNHDLPIGELHTDVYVAPLKMAVEVKSSTSPASILDSAIMQLGGEILFDTDAEVGCLAIADPAGWRETELLPVHLTDELRRRVEDAAQQVLDASRTGTLPHRTCQTPADARGKMCPYAATCFSDWKGPDPADLDRDVADLAAQLKTAQDRERAAKAVVAEVEKERKELAEQLAGWELRPGVDYVGHGVKVRRTHVEDSPKLSYSTATKAGVFDSPIWTPAHDDLLRPFVKLSGGHDRWKVDVSDHRGVAVDEFGAAAPWTSEDLEGGTLGG